MAVRQGDVGGEGDDVRGGPRRGTGLALTVVAGTAEAAKAPSLTSSVQNAVKATTAMVGTLVGPVLRLDNNGEGPALDLQVEPRRAPLTVSEGAGKATNLDADKLDGQEASAFLPAEGEARSAVHATRADAAGRADTAANADSAADADKLDGKDSADFVAADHGHTTVVRKATIALQPGGIVYEFGKSCQSGERATGGGFVPPPGGAAVTTVYNRVRANGEVFRSYPMGGPLPNIIAPLGDGGTPRRWAIDAYNEGDVSRTLEVYVVCTSGVRQPSGIPGGD